MFIQEVTVHEFRNDAQAGPGPAGVAISAAEYRAKNER